MGDQPDIASLVEGLLSDNESARKYAVFKLQGLLSDPDFADAFIQGDGLLPLRHAVLETSGNTQAYAFGSLDALLELDMGWAAVDGTVIDRAVALAITHPLVNIVRNVLTLLVKIVARPVSESREESPAVFGFRAIKPALDNNPGFLDALVQRLSASDHTLCANALQLLNALMRDAIVNGGQQEWPKFIKRLQDLGVISGVGTLMRGESASDLQTPLAHAVLEFQGLTKVLLKKWREVNFSLEFPEHKRALKTIHLLSKPEPYLPTEVDGEGGQKITRKHHPEKWRRLGFETESPAWEFDETGYLGIMDLVDYARRNEDSYQKILMEQSVHPRNERCPIARASLSVTLILYEQFEINDAVDIAELSRHDPDGHSAKQLTADKAYRPLLFQWGRIHTAVINAFMRLWKAAGAMHDDFYKIEEVLRIVVERIVGNAGRKTEIGKVEEELRSVTLQTARQWQMAGLDEVYEDAWGPHLVAVREQLHHESMQFMKEQRIRCLAQGSWFPTQPSTQGEDVAWRYVRLSHNRRWLHYRDYSRKEEREPPLTELPERLDLNNVTSVDSNVTASELPPPAPLTNGMNGSTETLKEHSHSVAHAPVTVTTTKITILGTPPRSKSPSPIAASSEEAILLELFPQTTPLASEWLDGLLMLLNQQPITQDTTRLVEMVVDWGVRLRMLNLRWEDVDWEALEARVKGLEVKEREVPSREGLKGEEFWYAMPET